MNGDRVGGVDRVTGDRVGGVMGVTGYRVGRGDGVNGDRVGGVTDDRVGGAERVTGDRVGPTDGVPAAGAPSCTDAFGLEPRPRPADRHLDAAWPERRARIAIARLDEPIDRSLAALVRDRGHVRVLDDLLAGRPAELAERLRPRLERILGVR